MNTGIGAAEEKREISCLLERLEKGLGALTANQDKLISRLCSVLRSACPVATTPEADKSPTTQLGDALRKFAVIAEERNAVVLDVLARLEL